MLAFPVQEHALRAVELLPDARELGFEGLDGLRLLLDLGRDRDRLGLEPADLRFEAADLRGQGDRAFGLLPELEETGGEEQVAGRGQEIQPGVVHPDPDGFARVLHDHGVLESAHAVLEPLVRLDEALELSDDAGPVEDVGRDLGPGRGRNEEVVAAEALGQAAEERLGRDDPGPGPIAPERVEEEGVRGARPDEVGQDAEGARDVVGRAFLAGLLVDLAQGLEVIGRFVAPRFQGVEPEARFVDGQAPGAKRCLDVFRPADQGLTETALFGDVPFEGGRPPGVLEEGSGLLAELGGELLFLADEQLQLLVRLGALVLDLGQGLQGLEVVAPQALDLAAGGLPGFARGGEARFRSGHLGAARDERFLEPDEAALELFDLARQIEDVLEELVAVRLGPLLLLFEELDPLRFALDVALDPGGLGLQAEEPLLAVLEDLLEVPEVLAPGGGVLLLAPQAGRRVLLAPEAFVVEGGGFLLGFFEQDELPLIMVGGQLPHPLAEAAVAVGRLGLALEGVLGLLDLDDDVLEPDEVLLGAVELRLGLALFVLVVGGAGGLLDEQPFFGRLGGDEVTDRTLFDDEIFLLADGVLPELVLDVLEPDGLAAHPVLVLAGAEGPVGDDQLFVVAGQGQDGVGHAERGPLGVAGEDDLVGPVAADRLLAVPAERPEHGVDEIGLARAVRSDDGRDAGVEDDLGPLGEGFESLQFELLDDHAHE